MLYLMTGTNTRLEDLKRVIAPVVRGLSVPHRILKCDAPRPVLQKGDVMFCMGNQAYDTLKAAGIVAKNKTVGSYRQKPQPLHAGYVLLSYDAGVGNINHGLEVDLSIDINLACRFHQTGTMKPVIGEYHWVDDFRETVDYINEEYDRTGRPVKVETDLETVGLDPIDPHRFIVSAAFTVVDKTASVKRFAGLHDQPKKGSTLYKQIEFLLTSPKISLGGANLTYDNQWFFHKWGITVTNQKFDTTMVGSLIDENRSNSLENHAKLYTSMGGYDHDLNTKYDKGRMDLIPDDDLLPYAGGDTDATRRVRGELTRELLTDPLLSNFYVNLLQPARMSFDVIQQNGILVNKGKLNDLGTELDGEIEEYRQQVLDMIPPFIKIKYRGEKTITASMVADYLFSGRGLGIKPLMKSEKTGKPKTSKEHLQNFNDREKYPEAAEFIEVVEKYNKASKARSTYVTGFLNHLRADDKFHPSFILFKGGIEGGGESGTLTGRLAARNPAIQTLPKHSDIAKRLRACYEPPEGYAMVEVDYSQGELRVTAVVANEPTMKAAYNNNVDLHKLTGGSVAGLTYEEMTALENTDKGLYKKYRQGGKPANFGLLYGMSAKGYRDYAKNGYGVHLTTKEAEDTRFNFFNTYSRLPDWHEEFKGIARSQGYIRNVLGRVRHLPLINSRDNFTRSQAERQAINSPIQGALSDIILLAIARFNQQFGRNDECLLWAQIHDAVTAYIKVEHLAYWIEILQSLMEDRQILADMFNFECDIPLDTDAEVSLENFASMKEWKGDLEKTYAKKAA